MCDGLLTTTVHLLLSAFSADLRKHLSRMLLIGNFLSFFSFFLIFHFLLTTLWFLVGFSIHKEWKPRLSLFAENCTDLIILAEVQPNYAYMYSLFELSASNEFAFLKDKSSSQGIFPNIFLWSPTYIVLISWKIYKLFAKIFPVFNSIVFNSGTTH